MRCLLLFAPQWIPFNPHLAGPAIASVLRQHGHTVRLRDLNIEFYNTVLGPQFLYETVRAAFDDFRQNAATVFAEVAGERKLADQPQAFQERYLRYQAILKFSQQDEYRQVITGIERAAGVLRDKEAFYDPAAVDAALALIGKACDILSAAYHPSRVYFLRPNVKIYYSVDSLKAQCENRAGNIFHQVFETLLPDLLRERPEFIGISLGDYSQLLPGLTLAMLLKRATNAHICIGGNLFGRYTEVLVNNPDFFKVFADTVIFNEGERPIVELLRHLEGQTGIEQVPNIIRLAADGRIVSHDEAAPYAVDSLSPPDFSDLKAGNYFTPEPIFNIQASRNCYWNKCSFCTHHFGSRYAIKSVARTVSEMQALQEAHGARFFHFVDEAISPAYLRRLSKAILAAGLDVNFYIYGRFEAAFDRELFALAHRAGLRMVLWGFESANERIYRLMNKGELAHKNERLRILRDAYAEGIWNFLFVMFGFPTESLEEAQETVDFLRDNKPILSHSTGSTFMLLDDSPMLKDLEKYSITRVDKVRNGFSFAHKFTARRGLTAGQGAELDAYKAASWRLASMKYMDSSFREKLFLYVCKFGVDKVSALREEIWL